MRGKPIPKSKFIELNKTMEKLLRSAISKKLIQREWARWWRGKFWDIEIEKAGRVKNIIAGCVSERKKEGYNEREGQFLFRHAIENWADWKE